MFPIIFSFPLSVESKIENYFLWFKIRRKGGLSGLSFILFNHNLGSESGKIRSQDLDFPSFENLESPLFKILIFRRKKVPLF